MKRICVVGAGAIGGLFLAWIGRRAEVLGIQLSALARGETLRALRERGLESIDTTGHAQRVAVRASDSPPELGAQDLVIVAVKSPSLPQLAPGIAQLAGSEGVVLQAMNGVPWWFCEHLSGPAAQLPLRSVDPDGALAATLPTRQIIGAVLHIAASQPAPGSVRHHFGDAVIVGEPAGGASQRLAAVSDLLVRAGFAVSSSERIQRDIWFKLWGNMTMNPISALTGATLDRILDDPLARGFCSAVMVEASAIGAAIGIPIEQTPEQRHAVTRKLGAFKTSMLQDVEAGRALELDALVGAVREIGAHLGLATPNIDALLGLTRLMAQARGLHPRSTA